MERVLSLIAHNRRLALWVGMIVLRRKIARVTRLAVRLVIVLTVVGAVAAVAWWWFTQRGGGADDWGDGFDEPPVPGEPPFEPAMTPAG